MRTNHVAGCIPSQLFRRRLQELQQCWIDQAILPKDDLIKEIYNHQSVFSKSSGFQDQHLESD